MPVSALKRRRNTPTRPTKRAALLYCPVDQREVPVRRHTEQALAPAGLSPDSPDMPLDHLPLVEVSTLVFDDKDVPVRKHRNKVRVELRVRELEPEGGSLSLDVLDPIPNLVEPVQVDGTVKLLTGTCNVADKAGVVLVELSRPGIGLVGGVPIRLTHTPTTCSVAVIENSGTSDLEGIVEFECRIIHK